MRRLFYFALKTAIDDTTSARVDFALAVGKLLFDLTRVLVHEQDANARQTDALETIVDDLLLHRTHEPIDLGLVAHQLHLAASHRHRTLVRIEFQPLQRPRRIVRIDCHRFNNIITN